jgi:hypothetical protein
MAFGMVFWKSCAKSENSRAKLTKELPEIGVQRQNFPAIFRPSLFAYPAFASLRLGVSPLLATKNNLLSTGHLNNVSGSHASWTV